MPKVSGLALLKEPFPSNVVGSVTKTVNGKTKRFKNVDPKHYLDRLNEAFPNGGYSLENSLPVFAGSKAVVVNTKVSLYLPEDEKIVLSANGAQGIPENASPDEIAYAVKGAQSDGLKLALKPTGLGRELYDQAVEEIEDTEEDDEAPPARNRTSSRRPAEREEPEEEEEEEPQPRRRAQSGSRSSGDSWADKRSKFKVPIGKHKGKLYSNSEVDDGWLQWALDNIEADGPNGKVLACVKEEIAYRKEQGKWNPDSGKRGSKPTRKRSVDEDDEEKF